MIRPHPSDVYILAFAVCQGAVFIFWRYFLERLPQTTLMVYWFGAAFFAVGGYLIITRGIRSVPLRHWPRLALFSGLSGLTIYLYMRGIGEIGVSLTAILVQTSIIFTVLLAMVFLGERPSRAEFAGIAIIMSGHVVLNVQADFAFTVWAFFVIAGTASQALSHFIAKGLVTWMPGGQINLARIFGAVAVGILLLPGGGLAPLALSEVPILVLGIIVGPFSFLAYYAALKHVNLSRAIFLFNTQPLFTIAFAYGLLGETLSLRQWLAAGLVLAGAYVMVVLHNRPDPHSPGELNKS